MKEITKYRKYYIPFLIFIFFFIDQLTKEIVIRNLKVGYSIPENGIFRFTHVRNFGSAFSLISNANLFLMIVGIFAIIFIFYFLIFYTKESNLLQIAISLQLSGALGNIVDRIRLGSVTDFIDVGAWPVFNIADSCISVGMFLLVLHILISWRKEKIVNEKDL